MTPTVTALQRITRLTPLSEVFAALDLIATPVAPRSVAVGEAEGCVLASDVLVDEALPPKPAALRDGWAVSSGLITDAGPFAPVPLTDVGWVETGQALPGYADAVLPFDALVTTESAREAIAPASPGESVMPAGADASCSRPLFRLGEFVRATDLAVLRTAGVTLVQVRRPIVAVISLNPDISEENDSVAPLVASALKAKGAISQILKARADIEALARFSPSVDALITIGGTGLGSRDDAVEALARIGKIKIHGMAIRPGETSALGQVGVKPVLMLPGRIDAALSAWLLVGTRLLQRLTHTIEVKSREPVMLARKITSTIGLTEVVLVRCNPSGLEPLAAEHFPLQAIGRAHGWVLVPASAEGYPASATVLVQSLP